MKRLTLRKLIVISQSESKSLEVPFSVGLNIILGGNKTGKSSIIKSIFTTLGCECPKVESDWKQLISESILFFSANEDDFCIRRMKDRYTLYSVNKDGTYSCIVDTSHFPEYSNALMDVLQVNMPCVDKRGHELNITPPLLFRFQYIDQDDGWGDIGQAFTNASYIEKWRENTNKYVSGYHTDEYFTLKSQSIKRQNEINDAKIELSHNEAFVNRIGQIITTQQEMSPVDIQQALEELLAATDTLRKEQFETQSRIAHTENELFFITQQLRSAMKNQAEAKKDASFAMGQGDIIVCPVCGAQYDNSIEKQLHIAAEHATAENLIDFLISQSTILKEQLNALKDALQAINDCISSNEKQIQAYTKQLSYRAYFVDEGKRDVFLSCQQELQTLKTKIDNLIGAKSIIDDRMREMTSRKRSKEVRDLISAYCGTVADQINLSRTFIKLKDFVQVIDKSGSDTPRLVYMYHVALYLYNLDRIRSPFNFLVIDTPNQQGQDDDNLNRIFGSLKLLQSTNGQVIIGTERATGLEHEAQNVVCLNEKRRCLTAEHYHEHLILSQHLHTLGLNWVHDNYAREKSAK